MFIRDYLPLLNACIWSLIMARQLYARKQQEILAGALQLRVLRPAPRIGMLTGLTVWFLILVIFAVVISAEVYAGLLNLAVMWLAWVAVSIAGPFQWYVEFREHGILTTNFFPWERVKHAKMVGNDVRVSIAKFGTASFRIASRDAAAVRELLEARLAPGELGMQANDKSRVM